MEEEEGDVVCPGAGGGQAAPAGPREEENQGRACVPVSESWRGDRVRLRSLTPRTHYPHPYTLLHSAPRRRAAALTTTTVLEEEATPDASEKDVPQPGGHGRGASLPWKMERLTQARFPRPLPAWPTAQPRMATLPSTGSESDSTRMGPQLLRTPAAAPPATAPLLQRPAAAPPATASPCYSGRTASHTRSSVDSAKISRDTPLRGGGAAPFEASARLSAEPRAGPGAGDGAGHGEDELAARWEHGQNRGRSGAPVARAVGEKAVTLTPYRVSIGLPH